VPSWRVHKALVLQTSAGLPKEVVKGLLEGVVEPDIVVDRKVACRPNRCRIVNVRHHAGVPRGLVEYYFNLACFYRARGDLHMAGIALGRALHYIHDGAVKATGHIHDKIEKEMDVLIKKLPNLCKNEVKQTSKAVEALCSAYLESRRLIERFMMEPQPSQKEALRALWLGRAKRWWLATVSMAVLAFPFATPPLIPFIVPLTLLGLSVAWMWKPEEYVVAMRGGVVCVQPQKYLPAITC